MVNDRQLTHDLQHPKTATKQIEPSHRGSRWSKWALHDTGLYYYRARYISLEDISSIRPTGKDWFVPNVRGGYIHYQSAAVEDPASQSLPSQAPELSTCSTATTPTTDNPSVPLQEASDPTTDEVAIAETLPDASLLMSGALQTEADTSEALVVVTSPTQLKRRSTTPKKHKDKKKHGKKLEVDKGKTKQVSNKVKVNKWLDGL
ncbi:uncharacterized protein FIESC28_06000 [Fusarium coffeatum]|uniref:Uncharacterized protein n=1 Tax=Fusarium coffeatum TaxID=231269 RepID=A0A366RQG7_9HYPO|nr:uncharacterized protein FIESC28_06000 [Fusarium coffeatum]RBR18545.1 hypothetical protein FIESC28_06000 [Fusarium coffeatum]